MDPEQPWRSHLYPKEPEEAILRLEFRSFTGCLVNNWASQVVLVVKNLPAKTGDIEMQFRSLVQEDQLEEGMATHSNILAWRIP